MEKQGDSDKKIDAAVDSIDKEETTVPQDAEPQADLHATKKSRLSPRQKKLIIAGGIVSALILITLVVPFLRYGLFGIFIHKNVSITVFDDASNKPVSGVTVTIGHDSADTDKNGVAHFDNVAVGDHFAKAEKKYYQSWSGSELIPIFSGIKTPTIKMKATGRTITVHATNSITGTSISDVTVTIGDTSAISNDQGEASVVVAVGSVPTSGTVAADHYTTTTFAINAAANSDQTIEVKIAPAGKVYYLSKATGVISMMSANLDGSDQKVVVAGTGKEYSQDTMIMATKDWKYVMLSANREGKTRLYLYATADNSLTKIDDDDANYGMVGWIDSTLVYTVTRNRSTWQSGQTAIKAYNAETRKLTTIDETQAAGSSYYDYQAEYFTPVALAYGHVVYGNFWSASNLTIIAGKKSQIVSAQLNGVKLPLKEFDATTQTVNTVAQYSPNSVYIDVYNVNAASGSVYDFASGKLTTATIDETTLTHSVFPNYLLSPSGTKTAWYESRDGKDDIFTGDANGKSPKQPTPVGYRVYGWFTDDYLLLTKNGSELYVYPSDGSTGNPLKITDYHKPTNDFMGGGYGGAV